MRVRKPVAESCGDGRLGTGGHRHGRLRPDLVLLDFGLSTPMGGFDVWRALRELDTVPDVIAVTAAGDMATVERAQRFGAFRYVVKPRPTCARKASPSASRKSTAAPDTRRTCTRWPPPGNRGRGDRGHASVRKSQKLFYPERRRGDSCQVLQVAPLRVNAVGVASLLVQVPWKPTVVEPLTGIEPL
jgi:CheY-like chemotaxis protein